MKLAKNKELFNGLNGECYAIQGCTTGFVLLLVTGKTVGKPLLFAEGNIKGFDILKQSCDVMIKERQKDDKH